MKVLMVNIYCGIKSTGRICTDIAELLEQEGHEVRIAYGRGELPDKYKRFGKRIGNDLSVNLHAIKARCFDDAGFGSSIATRKFIKWVEEFDPDVIHLHNIHGYYLNIQMLFEYIKRNNKRVIWTLHDCWPFTGHCSHFETVACEKWKTECNTCPLKSEYPKSYIDRSKRNYQIKKMIFTGCKDLTIVTPSIWLKQLVETSFLNKYSVHTIHNGIDLDVFAPHHTRIREKYDLFNKKILLAVASTWTNNKGLSDIIKLNSLKKGEYVIVIIGLKKSQIRKLPKDVIGIEKTNSIQELADWYSEANIFINPTRQDTFPTVNIEALSCGTPVITYRTGGSPEILDEFCGMVTKEKTPESLLECIEQLNNICEEKCLSRSREFDKWENYREYLKLYH